MDKIIDRDQLQEDLITRILDGMDQQGLEQLAYDYLNDNYDKYSVNELIQEVEEYYPDIIEEWKHANWKSICQVKDLNSSDVLANITSTSTNIWSVN